jgi:ribosomal protein S18 acetylase RimI-like enzyme
MKVTLTSNELTAEALYEMYRGPMEQYVNLARGTPWNDERERTQFLDQISIPSIQLIRVNGEVVGFIDFRTNGDGCNLHTAIVVPAWQSKGVGSIVLDRLMAASKHITLSVLKSNSRARSLYERKGFRHVSSTKNHFHLAWTSNHSFESDALETTRASS